MAPRETWDQRLYVRLSEQLRTDHDVVRAACLTGASHIHPCSGGPPKEADIELVPMSVRDDKALMLEIMLGAGSGASRTFNMLVPETGLVPLTIASGRLRGDRDVVLAAVSQTGRGWSRSSNLEHASAALRDDRVIVEAAIRANGGFGSLKYASERLRDDTELAALAVAVMRNDDSVIGYEALSVRIRSDRSFFLELLDKAVAGLAATRCSLDRNLRKRDIVYLLESAAPALQGDKVAVLAAVTVGGTRSCCTRPTHSRTTETWSSRPCAGTAPRSSTPRKLSKMTTTWCTPRAQLRLGARSTRRRSGSERTPPFAR